ncbi:FMN reductase [Spiractinospora alimapuensis]|uniref:FMN reductase n=1 Tax=Spiractinospora alimapuensis TaxID=2820884 RepID=UPI001F3B1447|nr:FMN reductase [Spiractinospora alimapuensis]QVQ51418.1 FMN reductase [Spiractinospora alimapuensis]
MTSVVVITAGLSQPSSTRLLADRLGSATHTQLGADASVEVVELRELAHDITDRLLTGFPSERLGEVLAKVEAADGVILVSPTFAASYSGLFKSFMDILDPDSLEAKPVLLAATGGSERHSLVLEYAMRPLLAYLRAAPVPTAIYAASADWGSDPELAERITRAAGELVAAIRRQPTPRRPDPFADVVPFEQLLRDSGQ